MNFKFEVPPSLSALQKVVRSASFNDGWKVFEQEDNSRVGEIYGSSYKDALEAYQEVGPLTSSVNFVARAISQVPIRLYEMQADESGDLTIPIAVADHSAARFAFRCQPVYKQLQQAYLSDSG